MVFLDGVGVGERDSSRNPFAAALGELPTFGRLLGDHMFASGRGTSTGGSVGDSPVGRTDWGVAGGLDALLGVPGIPQSATGQTALLTGLNAPGLVGAHERAYPTPELAAMLQRASLLARLAKAGLSVTFANTYTPAYFDLVRQGKRKHSATTLATLAAGIRLRGMEDLLRGDGVYQDFTNQALRQRGYDAPILKPEEAGLRLASIARRHDMTLYEYFLTDIAGHSGRMDRATAVLRELDRFLGAALGAFALHADHEAAALGGGEREHCVLVVSDHGNIEDMGTRLHTTSPAIVACVGESLAGLLQEARSILDVAPAVAALIATGDCAGGRRAAEK